MTANTFPSVRDKRRRRGRNLPREAHQDEEAQDKGTYGKKVSEFHAPLHSSQSNSSAKDPHYSALYLRSGQADPYNTSHKIDVKRKT